VLTLGPLQRFDWRGCPGPFFPLLLLVLLVPAVLVTAWFAPKAVRAVRRVRRRPAQMVAGQVRWLSPRVRWRTGGPG
jgi:hypothetical protein